MKYTERKGYKRAARRLKRAVRQSNKKPVIHVAVVMRGGDLLGPLFHSSRAPFCDWSCFVGNDRGQVVGQAQKAVAKWGEYEVWVGTLTGKAVFPTNFKVVAL